MSLHNVGVRMTCQRSPGRNGYVCLRLPVYVKIEWTLHNMVGKIWKIIGKMRVRTFLCDVHKQGFFYIIYEIFKSWPYEVSARSGAPVAGPCDDDRHGSLMGGSHSSLTSNNPTEHVNMKPYLPHHHLPPLLQTHTAAPTARLSLLLWAIRVLNWYDPLNCCLRAWRDARRGMDKSVNEPKSSLATVKHISSILHSMWAWFTTGPPLYGRRAGGWREGEKEGSKALFTQLLKISPLVNVVRWPMPVSFSLIPPILNSLNIS